MEQGNLRRNMAYMYMEDSNRDFLHTAAHNFTIVTVNFSPLDLQLSWQAVSEVFIDYNVYT